MKCPLCQSLSNVVFPAKGINVLDCRECSHRFAEMPGEEDYVKAVYDDSYFTGGGAGYPDYRAQAGLLINRGRAYADRIKEYTSGGTMLDVGSACGYILKGFVDRGWNGVGLEPNESMVLRARKNMGLNVLQGTLESHVTGATFDLIAMIQVIGHFYDPARAFRMAHGMLSDKGLILVEAWNRESFSAKIFGKRWHEYSPPSVRQWYSPDSLGRFLERLGFERIAGGQPSKHISGGHAKSLLKYHVGSNPLFNIIPDKVNIRYPAGDLFWALYRKQ